MDTLFIKGSQGPEIARLRRALAAELGEAAADFPGLGTGDAIDADVEAAIRRWQSGIGLIADGIVGPYCQTMLGLRQPQELEITVTPAAVRRFFPATKPANISRYLPYVLAALEAAGLRDRLMICAALGTIKAETEGFVPISEFPSHFNTKPGLPPFSAYDGRLGNSTPGDGASYRGRGFVQLTGRTNYRTYGQKLDIDLEGNPEFANAPEIAALLLATFLADRAGKMLDALATRDYGKARKLVNGGAHGLDRFRSVFEVADSIWPPAAAQAEAGRPATPHRALKVRKDPTDLRDRPYQPLPVCLPTQFPDDQDIRVRLKAYTEAGLIRDQGQEGSCTGFGLACVVNYLRWRQAGMPAALESVSPRMLYNFARRYDEYAGEDYEGSSCRGALKGWYHHGVCTERDWPYHPEKSPPPRYGYTQRARANTLGVYYRIDLKSITDLQAAILQAGAIYVSAYTHEGWNAVECSGDCPSGHAALPLIPFDGRPSATDGHAFALVGFNTQGFVVQNSWGTNWGCGGFAVLAYADWLANAMDAWVVALGVPGLVLDKISATGAAGHAAAGADRQRWWDKNRAYEHSIVLGNDGRVSRYLTEDELSRTLLHQACGLPDRWFRASTAARKRLVIYAHGGLNSEGDAIDRARAMGRFFLGNDCYPLFLIWKTGLKECIGDIVQDAFRKQPALAGGIGERIVEQTDLLVEKTIGRPLARPIWSEMKENAELSCLSGRGGDHLVSALRQLAATWGDALELHLVGHSAGSIILGHLLDLLAARGLEKCLASIHLYAPACSVQFANRHYAPHGELMKRLHLYVLSEQNERDDNVASIYRKSLLYLVSNALESDLRTPILGLANVFNPAYKGWDGSSATGEALCNWRYAAAMADLDERLLTVSGSKIVAALPNHRIASSHGSFDNNVDIVGRTIEHILGAPPQLPVDDLRCF